MTGRPLVLVPSAAPDADLQVARRVLQGVADVEVLPAEGSERQQVLDRASVLLVLAWRLEDAELPALQRLRFVQSVWAGVDRIPVARLCKALPDLRVASGSGPNAPQVAEHALGLYLDCARRLSLRDRAMRQGEWPQELPALRVAGSRVAVVGHGHVGRRVARALEALDAEVWGVNRSGVSEERRRAVTLDGLRPHLGRLDGVVLALPLNETTKGVVDAAWLEAMPRDGILVNVGRGKVVDETALYRHLVAHPTFHAGLDVWWHYPRGEAGFAQAHPFHELENVVMTPHSAFQAAGVREQMVEGAAANVRRFLTSGAAANMVPPSG